MNKTKFFSSMLVVALFATASVLTSCKDYDDDIKNLQQQIDAKSAKAELESLQSTLQTQLSSVQSSLDTKIANLNTAIANKADASTVTALASSVQDLTATVAALQTQLSSVNSALADYAKTSDVEALNTKYAALTGDVSTLKGDVDGLKSETALLKAADENLKQQIAALQNLSSALDQLKTKVANLEANGYDDTELKNAIAALQTKLADYDALKSDVATLKNVMQMMSEEVNKVKSQVNVLNVFVNKRLTSMILMPNFYWEGLEAIEVPFAYTPEFKEQAKDYKFTYTQTSALGNEDIAVTVKSYMTAALTDGQTVNLETAYGTTDPNLGPWDEAAGGEAGPTNLTEATIRTLVVRQGLKKNNVAYTYDNAPLSFVELSQGGVAKYHISPTTADLEGMKVGFFENDAEVYTRAAGAIKATPFETTISKDNQYNKFENGVLTVPFKVDGPKLKAMFNAWTATNLAANNPNWDAAEGTGTLGTPADKTKSAPLPFLAGQLTSADNDTTVTSDYAVLVPADITIIALADKDPLAQIDGKATNFSKTHTAKSIRDNHLYESVGYNGITIPASASGNNYGAITMPATHEIVYTDKSFDLKQYVQTHASYTTYAKYGRTTQDAALSEAELAALGLHYEFNIITYLKGVETTSQSAHIIAVDAEGKPTTDKTIGRFSVRSVDASGNTMVNEEATVETVGREPLIRVDLKNAEGKIVRYGYIKLRIAKSAANNEEVTVDFGDIYMNCGGKGKMTWAQVENIILRKINLTKQEFEKSYYLDVVGNYGVMPQVNPDPNVKNPATNAAYPSGALYTNAANNKWMAKRFFKDGSTYKPAQALADDDAMAQLNKYTATNNWFGRVWYTPHDNSMGGQNWDENTNVLEWNFGDADKASNMTKAAYTKMIAVAGATYKNKGLNQNAISTVVRFVNKNNGTFIYVTLKFEVGKIHFAYADINRRVLDHWYDVADGYKDNTADTIEVYANVPTPAILGSTVANVATTNFHLTPDAVDKTNFTKDLKEYWLNQQIIVDIYNAAKFNKFTAAGNTTTSFEFRIPVKGTSTADQVDVKKSANEVLKLYVNSYTTDYKIKKDANGNTLYYYWEAKGASGKTYQLYLATVPAGNERTTAANPANRIGYGIFGNQIVADLGGAAKDEVIATITADGIIHYNGYDEQKVTAEKTLAVPAPLVNSAASDILNYVGMYDNKGNLLKDSYLDGQDATKERAFTAFINIKVTNNTCYDPLIGKNTFNVRFLRPLNMWPAETEWTDAPNATQIYPIWKLVYIRDWRQYAVVPLNETQQFGKTAVSGTGLDGKNHKGDFAEGNVPYEFYGITNLYIKRDEIRSDAHKAPADRVIKTNAADIIANTLPIKQIPSLTGTNALGGWEFLKIFAWDTDEATTATAAGAAATGLAESKKWNDVLAYTNNGGVVKTFHVYVPISLKYPWGGLTDWTQKVWAVITINPTQGND